MEAGSIPGDIQNKLVRRQLFDNAMQGKWENVVDMYSTWPWLRKEKITRGGNTALHIAVSDRQERFVEQLVRVILLQSEIFEGVLEIKNKKGNTPLHLAASLGNVSMCKCISLRRPGLVGVPNEEGETPLFLAARHGKMKAFSCLLSRDTQQYVDTRNKKGETILHCAIKGGHFKLAFLIIKRFSNLIQTFTAEGAAPVLVLANKPGAFRSGTYLGLLDNLIYHCVPVQKNHSPLIAEDGDDKTSPNWFTALSNKIYTTIASTRNYLKKDQHTDEGENIPIQHMELDAPESLPPLIMSGIVEEGSSIIHKEASTRNLKKGEHTDEAENIPIQHMQLDAPESLPQLIMAETLEEGSSIIHNEGLNYIDKIKKKKETNIWSVKVMDQLLNQKYNYDRAGWEPFYGQKTSLYSDTDSDRATDLPDLKDLPATNAGRRQGTVQTPILLAAKNGITEMVEKILEIYPIAIHDIDLKEKNIVLLAVENRHPRVLDLLMKRNIMQDTVFGAVDRNGNSALHLAAKFSENQPWHIPGAALQMQWEVLWYEYVKRSMPQNFVHSHNQNEETAKQIFTQYHEDMVQKGKDWLTSTATSCSVVATLIATVAFATSTTVPGGTREGSGKPFLEQQPAFHIFAVSSLIALCFSVTSTVMFLAILTSRHQERDFGQDLPRKLLIGLTSLFISILSILVTFCAGHFFLLKDKLRFAALPVYAVTCLPATFFALVQLPLYIDLIWASFSKVPQRWVEEAA